MTDVTEGAINSGKVVKGIAGVLPKVADEWQQVASRVMTIVGSPNQRPLSTLDSFVQVQGITSDHIPRPARTAFIRAVSSLSNQKLSIGSFQASTLELADQIRSQWTVNLHRRRTFRKSQLSSVVSTRYIISSRARTLS